MADQPLPWRKSSVAPFLVFDADDQLVAECRNEAVADRIVRLANAKRRKGKKS